MKRTPFFRRLTLLSLLLSISACSLTPTRADYDQQIQQQQKQITDWSQTSTASSSLSLTDLVSSPELTTLLNSAYKNNPGLQQTWLTLQIHKSQLKQTHADTLPQVDAGLDVNRSENSQTNYTGSITLSWQTDLWGKLSDSVQAAKLDVKQQSLLYQSARDSLAAEVIKSWLALVAQQHAITIEQQRLSTLEQNEQFILQRYRNGLGTLEDLDSARSSTAQSKASLESYQESYRQQQRDLKILVGDLQQQTINDDIDYPEVQLTLADLPQQTMGRRPDLQAAYVAIKAAEVNTRVAYKEMLPSLDIAASLEQTALSPRQALLTSPLWSLLGQLTAPLFHGGQLKAAAQQAELETAYQYQVYRDTLLTAVGEVEQALSLERSLTTQQNHIKQALSSQMNSLKQYQQSYRQGLVDILELLSVQQQTYDLQEQYDNLIYQHLVNRIDLGLALGLGVKS